MKYLDSNNQFRTDSLFAERIAQRHLEQGLEPEFTLMERDKEWRGKKLPSMYNLFMQYNDEYEAAIGILGSKAHWDKLARTKWFSKGWVGFSGHRGLETWREDMLDRDMSIAKKTLIEAAKDGDTAAAKKLADLLKQQMPKKQVGRPLKEEDPRKISESTKQEKAEIEEDLNRLNVIKIR